MKRILFLLGIFFTTQAKSQTILGITMSPAAPDDNDSITFYIDLEFPYMGCAGYATHSTSGNTVMADALHCMGMLAAICNDTDTVKVGPQTAGSHIFTFTLSGGYGGPPCSPPIQPNDVDSLLFTVSSTAGIGDIETAQLNIYPNPSAGHVNIDLPASRFNGLIHYQVLDARGRVVVSGNTGSGLLKLELQPGAYIFSIPQEKLHQRLMVVR